MLNTKIFNMAGQQVGEVELSEAIFGVQPNESVLHETIKNYLANQRQGTQSALTRAEVSGGGKKPWRQKGTGRARTGSTRSPVWTHGGVACAPKPRDYSYTINKKTKRLALKSALSLKASASEIIVIKDLDLAEIKTKDFKKFLEVIEVTGKAMVVTAEVKENVIKSARNIPGIKTTIATILSPYDIMNCNKFIVDEAALRRIEEVYA